MFKFKKNIEISPITLLLSLLFTAIQLFTATNYPIFRDELYYIDCANHPAFGYVDHPPLSIWILTVWKFIFGDSQFSIRIIPAFCGALLMLLTSQLAKELGGNKRTQMFASVTVFSGLYFIATGGFYSMNVFDSVFWAALFLILVKIINKSLPLEKGEWPKAGGVAHRPSSPLRAYWLLFGIIAGLGLMNKISVGYLGLGIFIAILLTKNRVWLRQKYIWLAGVIAFALFSPYIIWNMFNDFATIEFIQNAQRYKIAAVSPLDFLKEQILLINPLSAPVWIAGLVALLFGLPLRKGEWPKAKGVLNQTSPKSPPYQGGDLSSHRVIGITYLVILVLLIVLRSKAYYLAAVYPVLIAAGAVVLTPHPSTSLLTRRVVDRTTLQNGEGSKIKSQISNPKSAILYAYMFLLLISAALFSPMVIPILPPEQAAEHIQRLGIMPSSGEVMRQSELPQILADRFGWEEMTDKVAIIYASISEAEKKYTTIFAENYGEAGAINYYGRKYSLPLCISGHNSHWLWGPPQDSVSTIIVIGGNIEDERAGFYEVNLLDSTSSRFAMPFETGVPIYLCRGFKKPIKEIWKTLKLYI